MGGSIITVFLPNEIIFGKKCRNGVHDMGDFVYLNQTISTALIINEKSST